MRNGGRPWLCFDCISSIPVKSELGTSLRREGVDGGEKINSSSQNHIMEISTSTKSNLLFLMVNSDLATNVVIKFKMYYSNSADRYTRVPNTIKR